MCMCVCICIDRKYISIYLTSHQSIYLGIYITKLIETDNRMGPEAGTVLADELIHSDH